MIRASCEEKKQAAHCIPKGNDPDRGNGISMGLVPQYQRKQDPACHACSYGNVLTKNGINLRNCVQIRGCLQGKACTTNIIVTMHVALYAYELACAREEGMHLANKQGRCKHQ